MIITNAVNNNGFIRTKETKKKEEENYKFTSRIDCNMLYDHLIYISKTKEKTKCVAQFHIVDGEIHRRIYKVMKRLSNKSDLKWKKITKNKKKKNKKLRNSKTWCKNILTNQCSVIITHA